MLFLQIMRFARLPQWAVTDRFTAFYWASRNQAIEEDRDRNYCSAQGWLLSTLSPDYQTC